MMPMRSGGRPSPSTLFSSIFFIGGTAWARARSCCVVGVRRHISPSVDSISAFGFPVTVTKASSASLFRRMDAAAAAAASAASCHPPGIKRNRALLSTMADDSEVANSLGNLQAATACYRCRGEGTVRGRPSKKARAQRKREMEAAKHTDDSLPPPAPPRLVPCPNCNGAGIVPFNPETTSKASKSIPPIRPDVSVAIVGGGLGGLALALALQHRSVPCVVYERDNTFDERSQGYGLTMQQAARAVKALGLTGLSLTTCTKDECQHQNQVEDKVEDKFGITSKKHVVHKTDGSVVGQWGLRVWGRPDTKTKKEAGRQNAHIARQELRRMLLERLQPNTVVWGHSLVAYDEDQDEEKVTLTLAKADNNSTVKSTANVLVGADGIRSAVRRLKVGDDVCPLRYLDCIVILGIAPTPTESGSELVDGETVFQTADGVTRIYAMPFSAAGQETAGAADDDDDDDKIKRGNGEMMWQLSFPMKEDQARLLSQQGPAALKAEALTRCGEWHSPIPELLQSTPNRLVSGYPVYDRELLSAKNLRNGNSSEKKSLVTLIGDAAHPMSPFKGQGANQALLDACLLARGLYKSFQEQQQPNIGTVDTSPFEEEKAHVSNCLSDFECEMLRRSAAKVKASADAAKFLHSDIAVAEGNHPRCTAAAKLTTTSASTSTSNNNQ